MAKNLAKLTVDWEAVNEEEEIPDLLKNFIEKHPADHPAKSECVYVYLPCGTCGENGALVEAYCSGSGDSSPDFTFCEDC